MRPAETAALAAVGLLALAGVALTLREAPPPDGDRPAAAGGEWNESERAVLALLGEDFGSFSAPRAPAGFEAAGLPGPERDGELSLRLGAGAYRTQCAQCHGPSGRADTPTAALLTPRPRDFGLGIVKFTSTVAGARARREDLERTLRDGLPYTGMSAFGRLREPTLGALVDFSLWALIRGEVAGGALAGVGAGEAPAAAYAAARAAAAAAWDPAAAPRVEVPDFDASDPAAIERGARLFADPRAGCAACHGAEGDGRGPAVWDGEHDRWLQQDAWGLPAQPRDLRRGHHHGGSAPEDLYRRIHAGVKGTPMPAHGGVLDQREIADLVAYLGSLVER